MFYIKDLENNIVLFDENKGVLENTLEFMPQYKDYEILETAENEVIVDFKLMTIEEAKKQEEQAEKLRIAQLHLTAADVERALIKALNIDFDDIIATVQEKQPDQVKMLKAELRANYFYRGNPYVDVLGNMLGLTREQLDEFFETNDYTKLLPEEKPNENTTDTDTTTISDEVQPESDKLL